MPTDYTDFTDLFSEVRRFGGQPLRGRGYEISLSAHCRGRPPCLPVFRWLVCGLCMAGRHGSLPLRVAVVVSGWCSGLVLLLLRKEYSRTTAPPYPRILTSVPSYPRTPVPPRNAIQSTLPSCSSSLRKNYQLSIVRSARRDAFFLHAATKANKFERVACRRKNCQLSIINYQLKNSARCGIFLVAQRSKLSPYFLLASILPDKVFGRSVYFLYFCGKYYRY